MFHYFILDIAWFLFLLQDENIVVGRGASSGVAGRVTLRCAPVHSCLEEMGKY